MRYWIVRWRDDNGDFVIQDEVNEKYFTTKIDAFRFAIELMERGIDNFGLALCIRKNPPPESK